MATFPKNQLFLLLFLVSTRGLASEPKLYLDDPKLLAKYESEGFSLGQQFGAKAPMRSCSELFKNRNYRSFVETIDQDLMWQAGRRRHLRNYDGHISSFDADWLKSSAAYFQLAGIVARPDRSYFHPSSCGELRFIYRLAYCQKKGDPQTCSRLPMTVNLVNEVDSHQDCAQWLQQFAAGAFKKGFEKNRLETNIQISRWPYTNETQFSDQAHYLLRVFNFNQDGFLSVAGLENTPDVERLRADTNLRVKLREWISSPVHLEEIDRGIYLMPAEFLSARGLSVAPLGNERAANKLFSAVFNKDDFNKLDLKQFRNVTSSEKLLERLDAFTCVGCHQSQSIAGFHFLGLDNPESPLDGSLSNSFSKHFNGIQFWRENIASNWPEASKVMIPTPKAVSTFDEKTKLGLGGFCDRGHLASDFDSLQDRWSENVQRCHLASICASTRNGFPGGLCSSDCEQTQTTNGVCVAVPTLGGFSTCLDKSLGSFQKCVADNHSDSLMQTCEQIDDCRAEYVCTKDGHGRHYCAPPYFLQQLAVDHHRVPN